MTQWMNDNDPRACAWLRELTNAGELEGEVCERDIRELQPEDCAAEQCHFFAGIGGWPYALRLARWPDGHGVWTGSCPCQPLSCAGKRRGHADERHLWPVWFNLIRECRPPTIFGEQVASRDGLEWLDGVFADLEGEGYACAAADLCAAGCGAPHIRQRLYWVADSKLGTTERQRLDMGTAAGKSQDEACERQRVRFDAGAGVKAGGLGNTTRGGRRVGGDATCARDGGHAIGAGRPRLGRVCDSNEPGPQGRGLPQLKCARELAAGQAGCWADSRIIECRDGKQRRIPTEPALFPLADGLPGRVGLLRGYGNAIVPAVAAQFVRAFLDIQDGAM